MQFYKLFLLLIVITLLLMLIIFLNKNEINREHEVIYLNLKPQKLYPFNSNFKYRINNKCGWTSNNNNSQLLAVIIVTSYFGNVELRSAMRRAFPAEKLKELNIRRVFLLGLAPEDKFTSQNAILNENDRFGDLIQGNFKEAYRNLTYKHLMGLTWASNCRKAKFVIKMDDDIVVNYYKVVELLNNTIWPKKLLAGYVLNGLVPKREPANKWYVTREEFEGDYYPKYVSGWFYVTNPQVCLQLVEESKGEPHFWIDDVYVTGILALKLRINFYDLSKYFTPHPEILKCCINDVQQLNLDCDVLVGPNGGDNNLFFNFNEILAKCSTGTCSNRSVSLNKTCVVKKTYALSNGSGAIETYKLI